MSASRSASVRRIAGRVGVAAVLIGLAACSSAPDRPRPAALESLPATATASQALWSQRVGSADFPLRLAVADETVVAASSDGEISAWDLSTGKSVWRGSAGARLAAGVGSDGRFAAVVTRDNELVVLDAGKPAWRHTLKSRTVTPPLVAGERVFVQGVDRAVHAFDVLDGRSLWTYQRSGDPLTLLQPGLLQPVGNTLWVGIGPRIVAIDPDTGASKQELVVAMPRGSNEVERLADLVGGSGRVDNALCVRAFQTSVACLQASLMAPSLRWSRPHNGNNGVAADPAIVVGADASDRVTAWRFGSGDVLWRSERLTHRGLTAPALLGRWVVLGDDEGYVHLLSREDGRTAFRLSTDGSAIHTPPVVVSGVLLTVTRAGRLDAWRIE